MFAYTGLRGPVKVLTGLPDSCLIPNGRAIAFMCILLDAYHRGQVRPLQVPKPTPRHLGAEVPTL